MRRLVLSLVFLVGCAPTKEYQKVQAQLADEIKENDFLHEELNRCQAKNDNLKMLLKEKPTKFFVKPPTITREELEAIKKKAYEDAEKKFKARMTIK